MGLLSELTIPTEEVRVSATQTVTVRGLSLEDLVALFRTHGQAFESVWADNSGEPGDGMGAMARALLTSAPEAAAEVIALAAGEPESVETAAGLPGPVQVKALCAVATLTFESEEEVGNLMEIVIQGSEVASRLVSRLTTPAP